MAYTKLSNAERRQRDIHIGTLEGAWGAIQKEQEAVESAVADLNEKIDAYNTAVAALNAWKEDIVNVMEQDFEDRSEKWQEGEKGQAYQNWKDEWENFIAEELEAVEVEYPEPPSAAEDIVQLPEELQ